MSDYDFDPPSFSLGLDFDLDSEPQPDPSLIPPANRPSTGASGLRPIDEDDDDFESPVKVSEPPRAFKRLRRGPTVRITSAAGEVELEDVRCDADDDIEDFSDEEDWPRGSLPTTSVCSSSKPSLHAQRVVTSEWKSTKEKKISSASASGNMDSKGSNVIFPKLTISPLRRFQLIDSDSDDPSVIKDTSREVPHNFLSPKNKQSDSVTKRAFSNLSTSVGKFQNEDLWKDLCTEKSSCIPTPAFDEVCEEYFTNAKKKSKPEINYEDTNDGRGLDEASLPPAHRYFFHNDSRIQKLVRDRLPYFFPLGAGSAQEDKQHNGSVIDYMGQFGHEGNSTKTDRRVKVDNGSAKSKGKFKKSQIESLPPESENWVNPRSTAGLQKNAGSRRVQAVGKSGDGAGHWYMGSNGQRVYVNKSGQELTGRIAYMQYRKESGRGSKTSKKKTAGKSKTVTKKSVP